MKTPEAFTAAHHDALRAWARGLHPLAASTELLICGCGTRFAAPGQPWVHVEDLDRAWIDFDELAKQLAAGGPWSGGQHRLLVLSASLEADGGLLNGSLAGLDRDNLALVLTASVTPAAATNTDPSSSWSTTPASATATRTGSRCTPGRKRVRGPLSRPNNSQVDIRFIIGIGLGQ